MSDGALVLEPATVWTAAGVLLSVQSAATAWRAAAKSEEPPQHPRDPLWLPCAEMLNLFSIAVCVVGVFVVPLLAQSRQAAESGFCVYVLLHGGVPLAYLGHYEAFAARDRSGAYCPPQERNCVLAVCGAVVLYLVVALVVAPVDDKSAVAGLSALIVPACIFFAFFAWRASDGRESYQEMDGGPAPARRRYGYGRDRFGRGTSPTRGTTRIGGATPRAPSPPPAVLSEVPRGVPDTHRSYASRV